jgi:hypothetical protein
MKNTILMTVLLASSFAFASNRVIAERKTHVGFAPRDYAGLYTVQLTEDGALTSINNKGVIIDLAQLSRKVVDSIQKEIDQTVAGTLPKRNRPPCMDAPSSEVVIHKTDGTEIVTEAVAGCFDAEMDTATTINRILDGLFGLEQLAR